VKTLRFEGHCASPPFNSNEHWKSVERAQVTVRLKHAFYKTCYSTVISRNSLRVYKRERNLVMNTQTLASHCVGLQETASFPVIFYRIHEYTTVFLWIQELLWWSVSALGNSLHRAADLSFYSPILMAELKVRWLSLSIYPPNTYFWKVFQQTSENSTFPLRKSSFLPLVKRALS
jgi:hypothetical protein